MTLVEILAAGYPNSSAFADKTRVKKISFDLLIENKWVATTRQMTLEVSEMRLHKMGEMFGELICKAGMNKYVGVGDYKITNGDYIRDFGNGVEWVEENGGVERWRDSTRRKHEPNYCKNSLLVNPNDLHAVMYGVDVVLKSEESSGEK